MAQTLTYLALDLGIEHVRAVVVQSAIEFARLLADGWSRAPALMAGLAAIVVVPVLAIAGLAINRWFARRSRAAGGLRPIRTELAAAAGLGWPCDGWLVVDGGEPMRRAVPRELLSIGRDDDNDLMLDDATVHRHHALLVRNSEAQFVLRDVSGKGGNGMKVNGHRVEQIMLADGDRIEIGRVVLKFEAHPA